MIAFELGSIDALAMFWFQALSAGNGMNPFRLAPWPSAMLEQLPFCASNADPRPRRRSRRVEIVRIEHTPERRGEYLADHTTGHRAGVYSEVPWSRAYGRVGRSGTNHRAYREDRRNL